MKIRAANFAALVVTLMAGHPNSASAADYWLLGSSDKVETLVDADTIKQLAQECPQSAKTPDTPRVVICGSHAYTTDNLPATTDRRRAWTTYVTHNETNTKSKIAYIAIFSEYDCQQRTELQISIYNYKRDGNVLSFSDPVQYSNQSHVVPGTLGEDAFEFICSMSHPDEAHHLGNVDPKTIFDEMLPKVTVHRRKTH